MMTADHFIDAKTEQAMRARIVELYHRHGLKAFRLPGVQQAIALLVDARMPPIPREALSERALRRRGLLS
jgi:hypothetical protein